MLRSSPPPQELTASQTAFATLLNAFHAAAVDSGDTTRFRQFGVSMGRGGLDQYRDFRVYTVVPADASAPKELAVYAKDDLPIPSIPLEADSPAHAFLVRVASLEEFPLQGFAIKQDSSGLRISTSGPNCQFDLGKYTGERRDLHGKIVINRGKIDPLTVSNEVDADLQRQLIVGAYEFLEGLWRRVEPTLVAADAGFAPEIMSIRAGALQGSQEHKA